MNILYKNSRAKKQFSSEYKKKWVYPDKVKEKLLSTENFIQQATSLLDIFQYAPFRFHQLEGDRKYEWSICLGNTGFRVTVLPCDKDGKPIKGEDILRTCKSIKIIMVTEVSNHYE